MNEDETTIEAGAAGAPEGAVNEPTVDEVGDMYEDLGIKAPVPTGKPKGRPKASSVRAKDVPKKGAGDSDAGKQEDEDDKGKSKDAPDSDKNGGTGDDTDKKGKKVSKDSAKVSDESEEADDGVRDSKSTDEKDSKRGSEEDPELGDDGAGEKEHESEDEKEEGKRPGKSNPEVEKRFQKLTGDVRERDEVIADLQKKLQESTQKQYKSQVDQEDPEYTVEDFHKVRDQDGDIVDLDEDQAELAYRRWKDGYDQRASEREARVNHAAAEEERSNEMTRQIMQDSTEAYDTLAGLMDEYPELVSTSGQFDEEFASEAMPLIENSIIYAEGTEPGNTEDKLPVIMGMRMNPKQILDAMKKINNKKRSLPLNGVNDNIETRSNVNVPHSRSSDSTVNAANDLYKELGIKKRI